jgi:hypothetical protein
MSGIIGGAGSKSGVIGENSPKPIGIFSPVSHNTTSADGEQSIDLSKHENMLTNYTSYVTQSGSTLTVVKSGVYHIDLRTLSETDAVAQLNIILYVTGYSDLRTRIQLPSHTQWNGITVSGTFQLVAGNTIVGAVNNGAVASIHHHHGAEWTAMTITYLGTGR